MRMNSDMEGCKKKKVMNRRTRHKTRQGVVETVLISVIPNLINNVDYCSIDIQLTLRAPRRVNDRPQLNVVKREESHINEAREPGPDGSCKLTVEKDM